MPDPVIVNLLILLVVLIGPFINRRIEHNLEAFLFVMGVLSAAASGVLSLSLVEEALRHPIPITAAVFIFGMAFAYGRPRLLAAMRWLLARSGPALLAAVASVVLGLVSSVITAIIASLVLTEVITTLRLPRAAEVWITVLACYAIGLGAALTPIGEPLSTIAVAKLRQDFWYLVRLLGPLIIPGVIAVGIAAGIRSRATMVAEGLAAADTQEAARSVVARAARVYLFVMALTLLGEGFKPVIERYVIGLDARLLYWINTISAVVDNATLTAAEIDPRMTAEQVRAVLMGLLVSGGMLIPGNIPNIISAGKLHIGSREWARVAVPVGAVLMVVYFIILFIL